MYFKVKKQVPAGIRYLSQWGDFKLGDFPDHSIIHKQLPGCGFTEFALTCPGNVVLCSPRKMLMQNKKDQHPDTVYLVVNKFEIQDDIDDDISRDIPLATLESKDQYVLDMLQAQTKGVSNLYTQLRAEILDYMKEMDRRGLPYKLIVTYDSAYLVRKILESLGIIDTFQFCIDEFQSILDDSRFKSGTELEFLTVLKGVKYVKYVSATPMLDKYLERIPELNLIPYFELDWKTLEPGRIKKPNLKVRTMNSVGSKMEEIIKTYLEGNYEEAIVERDGQLVKIQSREAIFYVNSVNHIINIIKRMNLIPSQCNILCSDTPFNQKRIRQKLNKKKAGLIYEIGSVPLKGQPHKMFTFCTRTVYLGADFYSDNARSFIFSDSNSDCLAVDISTDLYQILGRLRDDLNPWHNSAEFYYRATCDYKKMTWEDFQRIIDRKLSKTNNILLSYNSTPEIAKNDNAEDRLFIAKTRRYKEDYVAVNKRIEDGEFIPVLNNLVMINDHRAFDIQQIDYADRFSVFSSISQECGFVMRETYIDQFFLQYDSLTTYVEKIHYIVDFLLENPEYSEGIINNLAESDKIKQQLVVLGPSRIKGLGYNLTRINKAMGITIFDKSTFLEKIYSSFEVKQRYTNKYIKEKLGEIYKAADFKGTPKATDLGEWFEIKAVQISIKGKRENGLEIIKVKGS